MAERVHLDFYKQVLRPDPSRTVVRPFDLSYPQGFDGGPSRIQEIVDRIVTLKGDELAHQFVGVTESLDENHRDVDGLLMRRFDEIADQIKDVDRIDTEQRRLIGAYFSEEYAYEAAALFNPSIIRRRDQSDMPEGTVRFVLSLRGIGEGHVSSVTFRTGTWTPGGDLVIDEPSPVSMAPIIRKNESDDDTTVHVDFDSCKSISEMVLFPMLPSQRQGIEDLRLVRFEEEDGSFAYHGTYTAFSGAVARSELLTGTRFGSFDMRALTGSASGGKGMALFPRKVGGKYAMLGRQDNENIWLHLSDDVLHWEGGTRIIRPHYPWEFIQMGNCGSPIEIDEGWLVLTHGVGSVRNYCIGASLLDKDDPTRLIKRMQLPLVHPSPKERDGYVPNVVYSRGGLVRDRMLLLPYGVADSFTTFATVKVDDMLAAMV